MSAERAGASPQSGGPWPWRDADLLWWCAMSGVGLIALGVSWYGISGMATPAGQALWINVAVAGIAVSALGNAVRLLRGRRAIGLRRIGLVAMRPPAEVPAAGPQQTVMMPAGLVRVAGMARVHWADCPLVAGKRVTAAVLGDGEPCGVCAP